MPSDGKPSWFYHELRWRGTLAISNCFLALANFCLVAGGIYAIYSAEHAIHNEATNHYVTLWNSDYMLQQRRTLARALLKTFKEKDFDASTKEQPTPKEDCPYKGKLEPSDLHKLYWARSAFMPDPDPKVFSADTKEFSAFESVRTFFEQLGTAYREKDLDPDEAFEVFSLPAEAYWTAGVSGWLDKWLKENHDPTIGTEFRYFECAAEFQEPKRLLGSELLVVLRQDANLPEQAIEPPRAGRAGELGSRTFGPRIPTDYFVTTGAGQSDEGIPPDPYETFSYDLALQQAGIENFNVVPYTSVLPPEATEVPLLKVKSQFHHGAVLETIMAKEAGIRNETVCAGIGRAWAVDADGNPVGGYAAEYRYKYHKLKKLADGESDAIEQLTRSLDHELAIRDLKQSGDKKYSIRCLAIHKKYGMAIAAIGFVNFIFPDAKTENSHD